MLLNPPQRPTTAAIQAAFTHLGFRWPGEQDRPVILGLRRAESPGQWNDVVGVIGGGLEAFFQGTVDPGRKPMDGDSRFVHPDGVARVEDGYHADFFRWHFHKSDRAHPCLGQAAPAPFSRWQDGEWVEQPPAIRGFNLHRARFMVGSVPPAVGDYSHGCAVIPDRSAHWRLMEMLGFPDGASVTWSSRVDEHGRHDTISGRSFEFAAVDRDTRFDYALIDWSAWTVTAAQLAAEAAGAAA